MYMGLNYMKLLNSGKFYFSCGHMACINLPQLGRALHYSDMLCHILSIKIILTQKFQSNLPIVLNIIEVKLQLINNRYPNIIWT